MKYSKSIASIQYMRCFSFVFFEHGVSREHCCEALWKGKDNIGK